ncbi:DUF7882 family protein [Frondihabitans sp. 762G35]|uniref:DUF7882 family protein n=1 Tax=Frondihabitans sp. 762G35 TaxID=1446794 RepID=UPI000E706C13
MTYSAIPVEIDDRPLRHLEIVIGSKLRRREAFLFSWRERPEFGSGRGALWVAPGVPLRFSYSTHSAGEINERWLRDLEIAANGPRGLGLTAEPAYPPSRR